MVNGGASRCCMTWSDFYLFCFIVGFSLSLLSFLGGAAHIHLPARLHLPFHGGHHAGGMAGRGSMHARGGLSWFNAMTIMTFMAWIVKVSDAQMLDWDYRIEGTVGTISSPVRENGIGEMIFEQRGVRKSVGARSEDGKPLPNGTEVAITRYENGIAYVKKWEEFTS